MLIGCELNSHSLDTQSTPHPQTRECALPDLTSAAAATGPWREARASARGDDVGAEKLLGDGRRAC